MRKIKHTETRPQEVHYLETDGVTTACGFDTRKNPSHWVEVGSNTKVTCTRNGCKQV